MDSQAIINETILSKLQDIGQQTVTDKSGQYIDYVVGGSQLVVQKKRVGQKEGITLRLEELIFCLLNLKVHNRLALK